MPGTLIRPNPVGPGHERIAIRIEGRVEREGPQRLETEGKPKQTIGIKATRQTLDRHGYGENGE